MAVIAYDVSLATPHLRFEWRRLLPGTSRSLQLLIEVLPQLLVEMFGVCPFPAAMRELGL
jgi:hypothetical protein